MAIKLKELELYRRRDLVKKLAELNNCTNQEAHVWLTNYVKAIEILLSDIEKDGVDIYGFETFYVSEKPSRKARNPMNGEVFYTKDSYKLNTKLSKTFIDRILKQEEGE